MQLKFGYKEEDFRRQIFISRGSDKIEDEYIIVSNDKWKNYILMYHRLKEKIIQSSILMNIMNKNLILMIQVV